MKYQIYVENTHSNLDLIKWSDEKFNSKDEAQKRMDQAFPVPGTQRKLSECGLTFHCLPVKE